METIIITNMPKLTTHEKLGKLKRIKFTKEGYASLLKQLEELREVRPAAVKELARARELGDLSENGLYTAAKSRLISIDGQIFRGEMTLKLADIIDSSGTSTIQIGSTIVVSDQGNETTYHLVGDTEANPKENKITQHSPLGRAFMRKHPGDFVQILLPAGTKTLFVKSVK